MGTRPALLRTVTCGSTAIIRCRTLMSAVLSLCAVWIAFLPLLQGAHIRLADHGHRFCPEHAQLEDVDRDRASILADLPGDRRSGDHVSPWLRNARGTRPHLHVACSLLNHHTSSGLLQPHCEPAATTQTDQPRTLAPLRPEAFAQCPLLLAAPKTSPPFFAA
jgi:hypothetical protein